MNITDRYRREHKELVDLATEITDLVNDGTNKNAGDVFKKLHELSTLLDIHLSQEDNVLYPAMIREGGKVKEVAEKFQKEMSGLTDAYSGFLELWSSKDKIKKDPSVFSEGFARIFEAINNRTKKEEEELYPLADELFK